MHTTRSLSRAALPALGLALAAALVLLASPKPAAAHHAFAAEFDATKPVRLRGKVTKVEWVNPHGWIHMDVAGPDGAVVNWAVELGNPTALLRRGLRRSVTLPDGRRLFAGSSGTGAPYDDRDSSG